LTFPFIDQAFKLPRNAVRDVNDQRFFRALCPTQIQAMMMGERRFRTLAYKGENQLS
jgi:hypothetical protein